MRSSGFTIDFPSAHVQSRWFTCIFFSALFLTGTFCSDLADFRIGIMSGRRWGWTVHRLENGAILL